MSTKRCRHGFCRAYERKRLAAATTTAVAIIDKQEDNDDKQQPGAINTVKQVPQTHVFPPPSSLHTMKIDAVG